MSTRIKWCLASLAVICAVCIYSCTKQGASSSAIPPNKQQVSLYLTDGPSFFDSVFVDIQSVAVIVDTCAPNGSEGGDGQGDDNGQEEDHDGSFHGHCAVRDTLGFNAGLYNIARLRNGLDTILATANVPQGRIRTIIVTLGPNSYLVDHGVTVPLGIFTGADMHIVIKLRGDEFDFTATNISKLFLDFDLQHSIIRFEDGKIFLRPVIRIFAESKSGGVRGIVLPHDASPVVSVYNSHDTMFALPNEDGEFMVRGLPGGTYNVLINASNGYRDTTITGVTVGPGKKTDIGEIHLSK